MWCWLGSNSSQLQVLGSIGAVLVALALGFVALRQAKAADAQAKAAGAQVNAANAQVKAANQQIETALVIGDTQTSPNIFITNADGPGGTIWNDAMSILNNGLGTAHDLRLRYNDQAVGNEISLRNDRLVKNDSVEGKFDLSRGIASGFQLSYKTMFNSEYLLEFQWHPTSHIPINRNLQLVKRGYSFSG